jgi:glyceraldehyde 3-phosphate dehydrogenase
VFVMGVNHEKYDNSLKIVSNASCTTNCLAPPGQGHLSTLWQCERVHDHSLCHHCTQKTVDDPSGKLWYGGHGTSQNMHPLVLPRLWARS